MHGYRLAAMLSASVTILLFAACGSDQNEGAVATSLTPVSTTQSTTGVCDFPIQPLTSGPVTKERLETAVQKMHEVQLAADAGDAAAASAAFTGDTHDITHDIDPPLRAADPLLARDLCESILVLEQQFGAEQDTEAIAASARSAIELLRDSGRSLGLMD